MRASPNALNDNADETKESGVEIAVAGALLPTALIFNAYATMKIYAWYAVPIFNVPPISTTQMFGLIILWNLIRASAAPRKQSTLEAVVGVYFTSGLAYTLAWIGTFFL